jgi:hypothetical protein
MQQLRLHGGSPLISIIGNATSAASLLMGPHPPRVIRVVALVSRSKPMAKYSESASKDVKRALRKRKEGTLKSGKDGKGGRVTSRKQAIAIGISEARAKGKKVPPLKKAAGKSKTRRST